MFFKILYMKNVPLTLINKAMHAIFIIAIGVFAELCGRVVGAQNLLRQVCRCVVGMLFAGFVFANSANAACEVTIGAVTATPASITVGDSVVLAIPIDYKGCQGSGITVKDNNPSPKLTYSNVCSAANSEWNCGNVTTVAGVTSSSFTPGNNGQKSSTLSLTYTATSVGTVTLTYSDNLGTSSASVPLTISWPAALATYSMDEASWSGAVGEVLDSSGSYSGRAMNSASTTDVSRAIPGNPGTCRYGVFDNSPAITQGYVALPSFPNLTTDFTVTAWIRTSNNTVGAQRILIDDESNTGGYGMSLGEGGTGVLRFYARGSSVVILDTPINTIANNTWYFVAGVADITNGIRKIYVYDATGNLLPGLPVSVASTGWGTDTGMTSIGGETNASGEPPANHHFRGNIDEVQVYGKVLNQGALTSLAKQTHPCAVNALHHLEIQSSGSGLTCAASTLTVLACQDATCGTLYIGGVNGTLGAAGTPTVNWDGNTGGATGAGFVIPLGASSVTKNVRVATAGSVVFGITSPLPAPTNATTCNFGSPSCTFTANTAGFIFSDTSTPGTGYPIPAQRSGIATPTLYLRAVQTSTTNPAVCSPAIVSSTTQVNMGYTCNNPTTCQAASNLATINATVIAAGSPNANPTQFSTPVSLTFDANGSARITARYDDVGRITLNASTSVTPFGGATPVTLSGSSNAFVVAPHRFGFSAITAGPIKAGNSFAATVTAYNGLTSPTATGNFGKESAPQSVTLTSTLVTPNPVTYPAASNPTLGNSVIPDSEFGAGGMVSDPAGVATVNNLSWGEVGNITLTADLTNAAGYLGSGLNASGTSASVGAFIPDHFDTAVVASAGVPMPCPTGLTCPTLYNGFIYSGQPFKVQVTAKNLANGTTTNYRNAYGLSHDVTLEGWDGLGSVTTQNPPGAGLLANATVTASAFDSVSPGVASTSAPTYTLPSATLPTYVYLRAVDTVHTTVTSRRATPASSVEGGVMVVSGRVKIPNVYGSELLPLPVTVTVQYYKNASAKWVTSTTDSVSVPGGTVIAAAVTGTTLCTGLGFATTPAPVVSGIGSVTLTKPTNGRCSADITLSSPSYLPSVSGRATFGIFKSPLIYRRENY